MPEDDSVLPAISVSRTSTESRNSRASSSNSRSKQAEQHPHDDAEAGAAAARRRSQWASGGGTSPGPNHARKKAAYARWRFGKQQAGGGGTWKRVRDPEPEWKIAWDGQCFPNGRVLIIDYISSDDTATSSTATKNSDGKRHTRIQAQEFQVLSELERFYADPRRVQDVALRVVHVQNAAWATAFLIGKFNMDHRDEMVGMPGFSRWAKYEKPRQRNGKPFPYGRTWRPQTDPWRNVSRTAFGMDYLKPYETPAPDKRGLFPAGGRTVEAKLLHLNAYEDGHSPHGFDVSVQRVSVYAQRSLGPASLHLSPDVDIRNPYLKKPGAGGAAEGKKSSSSRNNGAPPTSSVPEASAVDKKRAFLRAYDNGNTVIVFETSASRQLDDCLIQPRNDFENRWRRLSFFLSKEDALNDNRLAAQCTNIILADVFHGLRENWGLLLAAAANHVALLEDKIYENPADESRAPELWTNQAHWLKVDKVLWLHSDIVREMQGHLRDLAEADHDAAVPEPGGPVELDWLANTPAEYDRVAHSINEDLIQPTNNLSDLMYKSVGIRDSRQSLQLGLSMWRLSWITFIFLPLNFITSFWGMNSSLFEYFPSVGWYFLSAAILMLFVLFLWYAVKHSLQRSRQTPYQRGLYENLFNYLEETYPQLWTSNGAVNAIDPRSFIDSLKWRLLKRWFAPERTINKKLYSSLAPDGDTAELGSWDNFKRNLLLRWLPNFRPVQSNGSLELAEAVPPSSKEAIHFDDADTIETLVKMSVPIAVAEAEPSAVVPLYGLRPLTPRGRSSRRSSEDRPSSRGSSGLMVEERNLSDSDSDAREGSLDHRVHQIHVDPARRASQ